MVTDKARPERITDDYTTVTEIPGLHASMQQIQMLYERYRFALQFCEDKQVLEVGCGAGLGLPYLAGKAHRVVGGDCTENVLRLSKKNHGGRIPLLRLDAQTLPFCDRSFDVIILYEAIYYLSSAAQFLMESHRVLREEGILLICSVNKECRDFHPSPFSVCYYSANELLRLLREHSFQVKIFGGFPTENGSSWRKLFVSILKRMAVTLHLMPRTMKGKEFLKRIFFGKLVPLPVEVKDGMAKPSLPVPLAVNGSDPYYKIIYAVAHPKKLFPEQNHV